MIFSETNYISYVFLKRPLIILVTRIKRMLEMLCKNKISYAMSLPLSNNCDIGMITSILQMGRLRFWTINFCIQRYTTKEFGVSSLGFLGPNLLPWQLDYILSRKIIWYISSRNSKSESLILWNTDFSKENRKFKWAILQHCWVSERKWELVSPVFSIRLNCPALSDPEVQKQSRQISLPMYFIPLDFRSVWVSNGLGKRKFWSQFKSAINYFSEFIRKSN